QFSSQSSSCWASVRERPRTRIQPPSSGSAPCFTLSIQPSRREPTFRHSPAHPPAEPDVVLYRGRQIGMAVSTLPARGRDFRRHWLVGLDACPARLWHREICLCDRTLAEYIQVAESWHKLPSILGKAPHMIDAPALSGTRSAAF